MSKKNTVEIILTALDKGFSRAVNKGKGKLQELGTKADTAQKKLRTLNSTTNSSAKSVNALRNQVVGLVGAFVGVQVISQAGQMMKKASTAANDLEASLKAANRQFEVGSLSEWEDAIGRLSDKLKIYSETDIKNATARTVDMTKRLGLSAEQMEKVIALTGDLSAGKTNLEDGIKRVIAALRGEDEASESLGLTLNENYVKAWHNAHNATAQAWKDLSDLGKEQVRYNIFLEQAIPLQGRAAESINTFAGALALVKKEINDGIVSQNDDLVESLNDVAAVLRDNSDELGEMAAAVAKGAAKVIAFVAANKDLLIGIGKWSLIFGGAAKAVSLLVTAIKSLHAAVVVLASSKLPAYLSMLSTRLSTARIATMGLSGALGAAAGSSLALMAGFKLGTSLYEWTEPAEKALRDLQHELDKTAAKYRQFAHFQPTNQESLFAKSEKDLRKYENALISAFKHQSAVVQKLYVRSREKTFWGNMTDGARKAEVELVAAKEKLKQIETAMDEYGEAADKVYGSTAEAAKRSANSQKQVSGKALEEMKKQYQEYADKIKSINDEIAGRQKSLAEKLRAMARKGMTDIGAWNDRKKEAQEYEAAAKKAAEAGNFDEAVKLADQAATAYEDLNTEVKKGDDVLVSQQQAFAESSAGMTRVAEIAEEALKEQAKAADEAMDALTEKSGFQDLTDGMDTAKKKWLENWQAMKTGAVSDIDQVEDRLIKIKDKEVTIWINEKVRKALGGIVHAFKSGGKLAGYGGGDRIPALLEAGEFIIRKEAVRFFGSSAFSMLNSFQIPKFQTGGPVGAGAGGQAITLNLYDHQTGDQAAVQVNSQVDADAVVRILQRKHRLRAS